MYIGENSLENSLAFFFFPFCEVEHSLAVYLVSRYKLKKLFCTYAIEGMYKDAYIITVDKGNILEATPDTYQRIMYKCVLMSSQDGILYSSQDECTTAALMDRNDC